MSDELTPEIYKRQTGMEVLKTPFPDRIVLATRRGGTPFVWAMPILDRKKGENPRWAVTNSPRLWSYMFKDDGLFGYTDKHEDLISNSFETLVEAVAAFYSFYKK